MVFINSFSDLGQKSCSINTFHLPPTIHFLAFSMGIIMPKTLAKSPFLPKRKDK